MKYIKLNPLIVGVVPSIIFGFSFMFTSTLLKEFNSPFHLLAHRFTFAAIGMSFAVLMGFIKIDFKGRKTGPLLVLSLFQPFLYFIFETIGIEKASSSQAGIMVAFIPVAVTILAALFLKEKSSLKQSMFILLSISGVIIVNLYGLSVSSTMTGTLFLLGAVASAAVYNILSRKYSSQFSPVEITFMMMWVGAVIFNLIAFFEQGSIEKAGNYFSPLGNFNTLMGIAYLGILSSVIAFFALNYVLSKIEASKATIFSNLTTVVSIIAGVVILKESFTPLQVLGSVLIITGVWGTTRTPKSKSIKKRKSA